ncbi:hypothetical protein PV326_011325, partial [Microctonus aethiopoides]
DQIEVTIITGEHLFVDIACLQWTDLAQRCGYADWSEMFTIGELPVDISFNDSAYKLVAAVECIGHVTGDVGHYQNVRVLVVKDVAARGIHIPHLDNIMNFNFPAKSELFVHRVGRCARAGCTGTAYSIVSGDEYPYLLIYIHFLKRAEYDSEPDCIAHRVTVWGSAPLKATNNRAMPKSHWA